jgi:hypothetical protein
MVKVLYESPCDAAIGQQNLASENGIGRPILIWL